jgi:ribosomal-protein-alanine N-acetyltransferase
MNLRPDSLQSIRAMEPADLDAVAAIEGAVFPNPWPREALAHELLNNPFCAAFTAEVEGAVAGYAFVWVIYEQSHLINVAVDERFRGRGLGEALLVRVLRHAETSGALSIHLEVREVNTAAIALYKKYGFAILGRVDKYYADGAAALMMEAPIGRK